MLALLGSSSCIFRDREGESEEEIVKPISNPVISIRYCIHLQEFYDCLRVPEYEKKQKLRDALIDANLCLDISTEKKRLLLKEWRRKQTGKQTKDQTEDQTGNQIEDQTKDQTAHQTAEQDVQNPSRDEEEEGQAKISPNQAATLEKDFNSHTECFNEFKSSVHLAREKGETDTSFKKFIKDAKKGLKECRRARTEEFKTIINCR